MAVPPTIPTSFVPHPGGSEARRSSTDLTGAFGFFAYFVFALAVFSALGVFGYDLALAKKQKVKDAAVAEAERQLDLGAVTSVIRLRDRLNSGQTLLNNHVAHSNFFQMLEGALPTNMRLSQMHIIMDPEGKVTLTAAGTAKTLNTLAQASKSLATDGRIRDAIFSSIVIGTDNAYGFNLTATLDRELTAFTAPSVSEEVPPPTETL